MASAKVAVQLKTKSTSLLYSSSLPSAAAPHIHGALFALLVLHKLEDSSVRTLQQGTK